MRVAGIDVSTFALDVVTVQLLGDLRPEHVRLELRPQRKVTAWDGLAPGALRLHGWLEEHTEVVLAFVEHGVGASRRGDTLLGRVEGIVAACCAVQSIPCGVVHHSEWKNEMFGPKHGNVTADYYMAELLLQFPKLPAEWDENAYAAFGLAVAMRQRNNRAWAEQVPA